MSDQTKADLVRTVYNLHLDRQQSANRLAACQRELEQYRQRCIHLEWRLDCERVRHQNRIRTGWRKWFGWRIRAVRQEVVA